MEYQKGCKDSAVAVAEILEIVVSSQFAAEDSLDFPDLHLCKGVAHLPESTVPAIFFQPVCGALAGPDVAEGISLSSLLAIVVADDSCYVVWLDPLSLVVYKDDSICVSIVYDTAVAAVLDDFLLQVPAVLLFKRIWLMVREGSVKCVVDVVDITVVGKNILHNQVCHAVGGIDGKLQVLQSL